MKPEIEEALTRVGLGIASCEEAADIRAHIAALEKERLQRQADLYEIHKVLMWAGEWDINLPPPSRAVVALLEELCRLRECARLAAEHGASCAKKRFAEQEEHRKALVRAMNEGIESVAKEFDANDMAATAAEIRAMKDPEQCTDASCAKCRSGEPCH